ncbi:MAG: hypothetical protein PHV13_03835 [Candidatus ainarchaeum sp.]|nr:hypothetical protein [Candidatus ainarchaeum sp.]
MARNRNGTGAGRVIFNVGSLGQSTDSPYHYAMGRHLEQSRSVTAQLMSKHFLDDPHLMGEALPYGCSVKTPRHLRRRAVRTLGDW